MRAATLFAPLFFAATSLAQAVEEGIAPDAQTPKGCRTSVDSPFKIGTLENPSLRKRETAQEASDGELLCTLKDGILHDQFGRTGSIVANRQFQFDGPPQAGAIYTGGFSVCGNDSLAIGGSTRWWRCMSGPFGNLYDEWIGAQCHEIRIQAVFDDTTKSGSQGASMSSTAAKSSTASSNDASSTASASATSSASGSASNGNSTMQTSSSASPGSAGPSATSGSESSGASGPAGSSASPTRQADAPPANGAASSLGIAPFALFSASMVFLGAALML